MRFDHVMLILIDFLHLKKKKKLMILYCKIFVLETGSLKIGSEIWLTV